MKYSNINAKLSLNHFKNISSKENAEITIFFLSIITSLFWLFE